MVEQRAFLFFVVLVGSLLSFLLLAMPTFSSPLTKWLYFLHADQMKGVRFGACGWCLEHEDICMNPMRVGYTWGTQVTASTTGSLVLFPIAFICMFALLVALIPVIYGGTMRTSILVCVLAVLSLFASSFATLFSIVMFDGARRAFVKTHYHAELGPLIWITLLTTFSLAGVTFLTLKLRKGGCEDPSNEKDSERRLTSPPVRRRLRPLSSSPVHSRPSI